jgi:hypothetical protein
MGEGLSHLDKRCSSCGLKTAEVSGKDQDLFRMTTVLVLNWAMQIGFTQGLQSMRSLTTFS